MAVTSRPKPRASAFFVLPPAALGCSPQMEVRSPDTFVTTDGESQNRLDYYHYELWFSGQVLLTVA